MITYPCRCRIVDAEGREVFSGILAKTPAVSRPHIGKRGTAIREGGRVKITLDDGQVLYGDQCWWVPEGRVT